MEKGRRVLILILALAAGVGLSIFIYLRYNVAFFVFFIPLIGIGGTMFTRKMLALTALVLVVAMVSEPALAGVGGCRRPGVGGCGSGGWELNVNNQPTNTPSVLDSLRGAVPTHVITLLRVMFTSDVILTEPQENPILNEGVGGCGRRPGVGGCVL